MWGDIMFKIKPWVNEKKLSENKEKKSRFYWSDFSGCLYFYDRGYLCKSHGTGKPVGFGYWVLTDTWSLTQAYLEYPKNPDKLYAIGELTSFKLIPDGDHLFFEMFNEPKKSKYLEFRIKESEFLVALINLSENLLEIVDKWADLSKDDIVKTIKERLAVLKQKHINGNLRADK
mgnify:CR=1 FL=1